MFKTLCENVGIREEQAIYLTHHGHMSALDPCYRSAPCRKKGCTKKGDIAVLVSAGTGYTWAATAVRWVG